MLFELIAIHSVVAASVASIVALIRVMGGV